MINRDSSKVYIEAKDFTLQDYEERLSICENIFSQEIKKKKFDIYLQTANPSNNFITENSVINKKGL